MDKSVFAFKDVREKLNVQITLSFLTHFLSSMGLTLCNKYVASSFKFPIIVLIIQNFFTLILTFLFGVLFTVLPIKPFKMNHLFHTLPVTFFYIVLLWSSLEALGRISVPMMVVGRSVSPILTMLGETAIFGTPFSSDSASAILLLFTGSVVFALNDTSVNITSFKWLSINVLLSGFVMPLIEKNLVKKLPDQTPAGINCYRNLLSLPLLFILAYFRNDFNENTWISFLEMEYPVVFIVSCFLGFSISLAYFFLQSLVPATSIVVAQVFYKLATVVAGLILFPTLVYWKAWYGLGISFLGITWYTVSQLQPSFSSRFSKLALGFALSIVLLSLCLVLWTPKVFVVEVPANNSSLSGGSPGYSHPQFEQEIQDLLNKVSTLKKFDEFQTYDFKVMVDLSQQIERGGAFQYKNHLIQIRNKLTEVLNNYNTTNGYGIPISLEGILVRFIQDIHTYIDGSLNTNQNIRIQNDQLPLTEFPNTETSQISSKVVTIEQKSKRTNSTTSILIS